MAEPQASLLWLPRWLCCRLLPSPCASCIQQCRCSTSSQPWAIQARWVLDRRYGASGPGPSVGTLPSVWHLLLSTSVALSEAVCQPPQSRTPHRRRLGYDPPPVATRTLPSTGCVSWARKFVSGASASLSWVFSYTRLRILGLPMKWRANWDGSLMERCSRLSSMGNR